MTIFLPQKGLEIPGPGKSLKGNKYMLGKCIMHNGNYQGEGCSDSVRKHPFSGGGIDNIQNLYTTVLKNTLTK